jgi:hypothetical protein
MNRIEHAARHDLEVAPAPLPVERIWRRSRRRRIRLAASSAISIVAIATLGVAIAHSSQRRPNVNVQPTRSATTIGDTTALPPPSTIGSTVDSRTEFRGGMITNGPLSLALEQVVAPAVPSGAKLIDLADTPGDPAAATVAYRLSTGQELRFIRQHFTAKYLAEHSMSPESLGLLMTDPKTDTLTTLPTGSTLLKLGHNTAAQQVILARPNHTTINVTFWTPARPGDPRPFEPQAVSKGLVRLAWLSTIVEQKLDNPTSDLGDTMRP